MRDDPEFMYRGPIEGLPAFISRVGYLARGRFASIHLDIRTPMEEWEHPRCKHCGQEIEPDHMHLSIAGRDWTKWVHSPHHYICYPQIKGSPRAEPEDWEAARDAWIGESDG